MTDNNLSAADKLSLSDKIKLEIEERKYHQEWWKMGISALFPIAVTIIGSVLAIQNSNIQSKSRISEQTTIEKRRQYNDISGKLNIIFAYISDIGDYRKYSPIQIIEIKRDIDRSFFSYLPYWDSKTQIAYCRFMTASFTPYRGLGANAAINSSPDAKKAAFAIDGRVWETEWDSHFMRDRRFPAISDIYYNLVRQLLSDISSPDLHAPISPSAAECNARE